MRHILCQAHIPAIYVTHDHEEAFSVADRLILLKDGLIEQQGPPLEVFQTPQRMGGRFLWDGKLIPRPGAFSCSPDA